MFEAGLKTKHSRFNQSINRGFISSYCSLFNLCIKYKSFWND